jgi:TPP-dependent pyruvate/acetoin dehydrogenase alpha subunit
MQVSKQIKRLMLALVLPVVCASAFASGSEAYEDPKQKMYNTGKAVYEQKLACTGCAMAGKALDKDVAKMLLEDGSKTSTLSADEKAALVEFLKKRFKM